MKDASYLLKLARRCRDLEKTAIASEVIEQLDSGPPSWPKWPKILSPELLSPKWLNNLSPTDRGARLQESQLVPWSYIRYRSQMPNADDVLFRTLADRTGGLSSSDCAAKERRRSGLRRLGRGLATGRLKASWGPEAGRAGARPPRRVVRRVIARSSAPWPRCRLDTADGRLLAACSGDCDRPFRPKVNTDSGDRDHPVMRPIGSA